MDFCENLFDEMLMRLLLLCITVSLMCVVSTDFLSTAIVMATKEGSACLLQ